MTAQYYNYFGIKRLPRKLKKRILGRIINKSKLRKLLSMVKVTYIEDGKVEIHPYQFCTHCGCKVMYGTGNKKNVP